MVNDPVNNPKHYTAHPSGIDCIQITEHMGFFLGNAFKYIWRADLKHDAIEDLRKARWYLDREIQKRNKDMILELDDDFTDDITVANLAESYVSIAKNIKDGKNWDEDDIADWKELLPALMAVGKWYSVDFQADIKKAMKKK